MMRHSESRQRPLAIVSGSLPTSSGDFVQAKTGVGCGEFGTGDCMAGFMIRLKMSPDKMS